MTYNNRNTQTRMKPELISFKIKATFDQMHQRQQLTNRELTEWIQPMPMLPLW